MESMLSNWKSWATGLLQLCDRARKSIVSCHSQFSTSLPSFNIDKSFSPLPVLKQFFFGRMIYLRKRKERKAAEGGRSLIFHPPVGPGSDQTINET